MEGGKLEDLEKKPSKQGREPANNTTAKYQSRGLNPQPIGTTAVRGERITCWMMLHSFGQALMRDTHKFSTTKKTTNKPPHLHYLQILG
jgi:hypothetical protein